MELPATNTPPRHIPVLPAEVLMLLAPEPGQTIVDATIGAGGHSSLLVERLGPTGRLIGIDQDEAMLALARRRLSGKPVDLVQASFEELPRVLRERAIDTVDGVLADLGVCSDQIDQAERGFSFQQSGPLDMRLDPTRMETAAELVRRLDARALADIFWEYGEERFSRRIARRIVEARERQPLETTEQLADLVRRCIPWPKGRRPSIDPATRVFQALRIAVNDELNTLDRLLACLPTYIRPGGRAVLISFHSLEDRRVKNAFKNGDLWEVLTRKPVQAGEAELRQNPRSRSAKLRAARRINPVIA
jgi:16S rRNA (cytosine1402-N4)-methyltransferase